MASEKVTSVFPAHSTARTHAYRLGNWLYKHATTVYSPNRHGAARSTVFSFHPRVLSRPRYERISWKVVSSFQRPTYVSITSRALIATSVVKKYSSRCVPLLSWT